MSLLLCCGDVQPNPGPIKYPCQVCDKAVISNQHGIECSNCEKWCHRVCESMSKEECLRLLNCDDPWFCCKCVMPSLSDSLVEECGRASPVTNREHLDFKTTIFTDDDEDLDHQGEYKKLAQPYPRDIRIIHYNIQRLLSSINELRVVHESKPFSLI